MRFRVLGPLAVCGDDGSGTGGHRLRTHVWALPRTLQAGLGTREAASPLQSAPGEGEVLWRLGLAQRDLGEGRRADTSWRHALVIFQQLGAPQAADVRRLHDDPGGERP